MSRTLCALQLSFKCNNNHESPCCPHRLQCPRPRVVLEAVPRSSRPDCSVSSEHPDWEKHLEMSHYLRREVDKQVSLVRSLMHTALRLGANGTNVVPLLTVGVGAAMVGGATPSKPNEAKGKTQTSLY